MTDTPKPACPYAVADRALDLAMQAPMLETIALANKIIELVDSTRTAPAPLARVTDERLRERLASLIMRHAMKCIVTWKEAIDEAEQFLNKYTAPPNISDKELRDTWEGVKSLIASFEVQAEVRKEDLHNNCPVSTYYPIIEAALSELQARRAADAKCDGVK